MSIILDVYKHNHIYNTIVASWLVAIEEISKRLSQEIRCTVTLLLLVSIIITISTMTIVLSLTK